MFPANIFHRSSDFSRRINPEICISVVMDEPKEGYYGGKVCGPVFRDIAERCASYLNIPPDPALTTNAPTLVAQAGSRRNQAQ